MDKMRGGGGRGGKGGGRGGRGGGRSSFKRTNKLLNKHGRAYREQDMKSSKKRRFNVQSEQQTNFNSENGTQSVPVPAPEDHYSALVGSLKKKPRAYFEELLRERKVQDEKEEESEEEKNEEDCEEDDENESDFDEDIDEEDDSEVTDYLSVNFGSDVCPQSSSDICLVNVPHTLYKVQKSSNITGNTSDIKSPKDLENLGIDRTLINQWVSLTKQIQSKGVMKPVSSLIFPLLAKGKDVLFTDSTFENQTELLKLLSFHCVNHAVQTRKRVLKNNSKLSATTDGEVSGIRDQGFTRPKILVIFPFRNVAHKFIQHVLKIALTGSKKQVSNKRRFEEEYGPGEVEKPNLSKSLSYQRTFLGNNDDFFTLGVAFAKNSVKLYTDFYNSDLIVASPLGLRSVIGAPGDKERDFDFLSSIELVALFMCDVFLMQNWEHLLHCLQHLNLQPSTPKHTDFSRVKQWALDGHGKSFRQSLVFSSLSSAQISALFGKECASQRGFVRISPLCQRDVLSQILYPVRQVFSRIRDKRPDEDLVEYLTTGRYQFFVDNLLPRLQRGDVTNVVILIPSYYDFVRVRNYFKKENLKFSQLSEYSSNKTITNVRRDFAEGNIKYLLTTERFFFFKRYKLSKVGQVLFYESPVYAECYTHYLNMLAEDGAVSTLLYNKLDGERLERIVGEQQCKQLINSQQTTHVLMSE